MNTTLYSPADGNAYFTDLHRRDEEMTQRTGMAPLVSVIEPNPQENNGKGKDEKKKIVTNENHSVLSKKERY